MKRRPLSVAEILQAADLYRSATGRWPTPETGPITVPWMLGETWAGVDEALRLGLRGLPAGRSLAQLLSQPREGHPAAGAELAEEQQRRNSKRRPLSEEQILGWCDAFHQKEGRWPTTDSGLIPDSDGATWAAIDGALLRGVRGLPGGSSLARLLEKHRGVPNRMALPRLSEEQILGGAMPSTTRRATGPRQRVARSRTEPAKPGGASTGPCSVVGGAYRAAPLWPVCCTGTAAFPTSGHASV